MKKITFIGAGSVQFTTAVVKDLCTFPAFFDAEICLMDTDAYHLARIRECVCRIVREMETGMTVTDTTDREASLAGADAVICTVFNGDVDVWRHEIEIPMRYGVNINVGDTRSVSGIFRALRNIPLLLSICEDVKRICPRAVMLNYTNPMSMLCKAMQTYAPDVDVTGLCHSVQATSAMLAEWAGEDPATLKYTCVGINHMAFFTELTAGGKDLYPILRERIKDSEYYDRERVRNEVFRTFGYYVTESSGHFSEYTPWFRKRPDLVRRYCDGCERSNWNPGEHAFSLKLRSDPNRFDGLVQKFLDTPLDKKRGKEYAASILNARIGDGTPFPFNANVLNHGTIENLPDDVCVEVPVLATPDGYQRTYRGKLPSSVLPLVSLTANLESLAVEAWEKRSRALVYQAVSLDPLCSAVLSLEEIRRMCDEIFEKNTEYLGDFT